MSLGTLVGTSPQTHLAASGDSPLRVRLDGALGTTGAVVVPAHCRALGSDGL